MSLATLLSASTALNTTLNAARCSSIIKCSTSAKTCDCPTGCTCNFPLQNHPSSMYLSGYTINVFPKATATIDCTQGTCIFLFTVLVLVILLLTLCLFHFFTFYLFNIITLYINRRTRKSRAIQLSQYDRQFRWRQREGHVSRLYDL